MTRCPARRTSAPSASVALVLASATLLLAACASAPSSDSGPVSYRLDLCESGASAAPAMTAAPAPRPSANGQPQTVQVLPIVLDGALDQTGVALQTSPVSVAIAQRHLWASPLPDQLTDRLAQGLQQQLDVSRTRERPLRVVANGSLLPNAGAGPAPWRLAVEVSHFEGQNTGTQAGSARVAGRWSLLDANGVRASGAFDDSLGLARSGYPALVQALSCAWHDQAVVIAGRLTAR